ncbi:hypothetical protein [Frondihabitans sp. VKM Ac-2883]|uniref:hypothetical protein n=1 Tax=Frondihabitans sp. VKM Ac-2883 TaxID=2783823 RepID=UPI001889E5F0|nr:hypothetical protein [Frondihabitans sp. VKM Ac-2883]MBF4574670.1 hypothetical protein [Frondihabitans sp. VKM Ac-2883]
MSFPGKKTYPGTGTFPASGAATELVVRTDWAPVPRIEVNFTQLDSAVKTATIYRVSDGRTMRVRGGVKVSALGAVAVIDYEAPNGVPSSYRAEMFSDVDATVSLGFTQSPIVTLEFEGTCIHQPLDPTLAVRVDALAGTAVGLVRKFNGDAVLPEGARVPTWIGGPRQGLTGVPFVFLTTSFVDADKLQSVLGTYEQSQVGVMCIRTPPPMRIPRTFFAGNFEMSEDAINVHAGGEDIQFSFTADEVSPPAAGLVRPAVRRADLDAAFPTRAARDAAYLTRFYRDTDYSLAGSAG